MSTYFHQWEHCKKMLKHCTVKATVQGMVYRCTRLWSGHIERFDVFNI